MNAFSSVSCFRFAKCLLKLEILRVFVKTNRVSIAAKILNGNLCPLFLEQWQLMDPIGRIFLFKFLFFEGKNLFFCMNSAEIGGYADQVAAQFQLLYAIYELFFWKVQGM